ncbi:hypothetical protein C8R45DRAFT_502593 [Mycena sanguinolenta]|nr:hypothetical protein C8R45DRAFT_502593 [Mycena sanguinolenta]
MGYSSPSSDSVSMPSPIESGPPSTIYEAPSELSSTAETSLTSTSSRLTPLSRALSSLRGWGSVSSGTYESSILAPSPTVGSIALQDALDVSGETSFLRPTESLSSWDRMSTIPRSVVSELTPPPVLSSSLSDVSTPSSFRSESSSSLGRTLSLLTQSSLLSDELISEEPAPEEPEKPLAPEIERSVTPSSSTPRPSFSPSRPPSSVAPSTRSLQTPEASGSLTVSTPRGDTPSLRSTLDTVIAPSTHGLTLEHLADELHRLADIRGEENQDIAANVRALRNELRDLADFLHRPASRSPSPMPHAPSPMPAAPTLVPEPEPEPARSLSPASPPAPAEPIITYLEPPQSPTWTTTVSRSNSWLSSHYSDDDIWDEQSSSSDSGIPPDSQTPPVVEEREPTPTGPEYSPATIYPYTTTSTADPGSSESSGRPYPPSSPYPSSTSSSSSSSSTTTARQSNVLDDINRVVNDLAALGATYSPILNNIRGTADGLWQAQASTNHSLDRLRERHTELNDRMARIEDLLQSLVDRPVPPPQSPQLPLPPPSETSTSGSIPDDLYSLLRRPISPNELRRPVPVAPAPGRSFAQQLDDLLSSAGTGAPLEPAERPPDVIPFQYDVQARGLRPRSRVGITVPAGPPRRPRTVPATTTYGRPPVTRLADPSSAPQPPPGPPLEFPASSAGSETSFVPQAEPPPPPPIRRERDHHFGPPPGPVPWGPGPHRGSGSVSAPAGTQDRPRRERTTTQRPRTPDEGDPGEGGDGRGRRRQQSDVPPMPPPQIVVDVPPVFHSLMEILRENRLAQLATVDQQRELMRYMRGLNEWLERDVRDRQAELRGVVARVDQLREEMRAAPAPVPPGPPDGDSSGSSEGSPPASDGPVIPPPPFIPGFVPGRYPPVIPPGPVVPPAFPPVIPPVVPDVDPYERVVPSQGTVPFIPPNLPPPMNTMFVPGPAPIPPGGGFVPMPHPMPFQPPFQPPFQEVTPFYPPEERSPMEAIDPDIRVIPASDVSSSSSSSAEDPRPPRRGRTPSGRTRRTESRGSSGGSSRSPSPIMVPGPSMIPQPVLVAPTAPPTATEFPHPPQQAGQTIIFNPPAPVQTGTFIPDASIPYHTPSRGRSRHTRDSRSPRSSSSSSRSRSPRSRSHGTPTVIVQQPPPRSHSGRSRSSRRSHRTPPQGVTIFPPSQPGIPQAPTQPIIIQRHSRSRSRSSSSSGRSRRRRDSPSQPIVLPPQQFFPQQQQPGTVVIDSGRRSRSHSPSRVVVEHRPSRSPRSGHSYSPRHHYSRSPSRQQLPTVIMPGAQTTQRPHSPTIVVAPHRTHSRGSHRSRSPRHYPPVPVLVTDPLRDPHRGRSHYSPHRSHRSRSPRSRSPRSSHHHSRSHHSRRDSPSPRSRSPRSPRSSRHPSQRSHLPPQTGPIFIQPSAPPHSYHSHRRGSHSPTYISPGSRSPHRTHESRTHRTHHSPSRSPSRTPPRSPRSHGGRTQHTHHSPTRSRSPSVDRDQPDRPRHGTHGSRRPRTGGSRSPRSPSLDRDQPERPRHGAGTHGSRRPRTGDSRSPRSPSVDRDQPERPRHGAGTHGSRRPRTHDSRSPSPSPSPPRGPRRDPSEGRPHLVRVPTRPPTAVPTYRDEHSPSRRPPITPVPVPTEREHEQPRYFDRGGRPITPRYDHAGNLLYPDDRSVYDGRGRPITPPLGPRPGSPYEPSVSRLPSRRGRVPTEHDRPGSPYEPSVSRLPSARTARVPQEEHDGGVPIPAPSTQRAPPHPGFVEHVPQVVPSGPTAREDYRVPTAAPVSEYGAPPPAQSMYRDQEMAPGERPLTEESVRPLPAPGRVSPRPTATPFPVDLDRANAEQEQLERLAEVENRMQEVADHAQVAEDQRERDFRNSEEERERIFVEGEERRAQEARERQEAMWRDAEGLGPPPAHPPTRPPTVHTDVGDGASIHSVRASEEAASRMAASIKDTIDEERAQMERERAEMAAERAKLEAERDAARDALMAEKEARVRALEEELATLRGELDNEKQLRTTEDAEARERERQALSDSAETRAQLGDITNLIQDQREACERKKELMEERWTDKQERRQNKEFKWVELRDMVQKIHDDMEADRARAEDARLAEEGKPGIEKVIEELTRQNAEQRELLTALSDSWRADCTRQHQETIDAVRSTAREQVDFNVQGYLDEFSKALASEVRMLLGEVGKLREERRALQHELGYLLCMKSKYGPGGEFEPDWKPPPPGAPGGPPLDPPAPPPPDLPQAKPGWRTVTQRATATQRKTKKKDAAPPPPPAPAPHPRHREGSWATWQPDPNLAPTPPSREPTLLMPEVSPGLFGPRSSTSSLRHAYGGH